MHTLTVTINNARVVIKQKDQHDCKMALRQQLAFCKSANLHISKSKIVLLHCDIEEGCRIEQVVDGAYDDIEDFMSRTDAINAFLKICDCDGDHWDHPLTREDIDEQTKLLEEELKNVWYQEDRQDTPQQVSSIVAKYMNVIKERLP